jgi:hypothetical protein
MAGSINEGIEFGKGPLFATAFAKLTYGNSIWGVLSVLTQASIDPCLGLLARLTR